MPKVIFIAFTISRFEEDKSLTDNYCNFHIWDIKATKILLNILPTNVISEIN